MPFLLQSEKVHYRLCKSLTLDAMLYQVNLVHNLKPHFF